MIQARLAAVAQLSFLIALLGIALIAISAYAGIVEAHREAPLLRHPTALASSPDGHVFCYANWSQIVVLDSEGALVRSWEVPTGNGLARLRADSEALGVATVRTRRHLVYAFDGELLESREDPEAFDAFPESDRTALPDGSAVEIRDGGIVAVSRDGDETVLVPAPPWPLSSFPLPPAVGAVQGVLVVLLAWGLHGSGNGREATD